MGTKVMGNVTKTENENSINKIKKILDIFTSSEASIRPHFIEGGKLKPEAAKQVSFQKVLSLN